MIRFPNCKINLGLHVVGKRPDGFHNIETILFPVPLTDALEILPSPDGKLHFQSTGIPIPGETGQNLCVRAYEMMQSDFSLPGARIHLHKVIPPGSGLGGGSANGAYTLTMLNELFSLGLDRVRLMDYASRLGSDCGFFIDNHPLLAFGKGDEFEDVAMDLSGLFLAVVIPAVQVATADAYGWVVPEMPERSIHEVARLPIGEWKDKLINNFEEPVFAKYPVIGAVKRKLYDAGALYASMSGSGSAVYALFSACPVLDNMFQDCFVCCLTISVQSGTNIPR
jgi:4-diphosphocytidyl-2-C-methyl-D-erythritol kinase